MPYRHTTLTEKCTYFPHFFFLWDWFSQHMTWRCETSVCDDRHHPSEWSIQALCFSGEIETSVRWYRASIGFHETLLAGTDTGNIMFCGGLEFLHLQGNFGGASTRTVEMQFDVNDSLCAARRTRFLCQKPLQNSALLEVDCSFSV